ncbi:hypothetical protein [Micromonospora sp. Llam0]|uniref:hypothetical protein n=1 Tax=Micromonospora sp. Llam0 TaxID=2485143 RepID=UPI0011CD642E|nr:hypothetical protein [Micromonospora sp. Llam0]
MPPGRAWPSCPPKWWHWPTHHENVHFYGRFDLDMDTPHLDLDQALARAVAARWMGLPSGPDRGEW